MITMVNTDLKELNKVLQLGVEKKTRSSFFPNPYNMLYWGREKTRSLFSLPLYVI